MYKSKEVTLGSFEIQSNEIYISDPCYEYDENDMRPRRLRESITILKV